MILMYRSRFGASGGRPVQCSRLLTARPSITWTSAPRSFSSIASECPMKPAPPTSAMRLPATSSSPTDCHLRERALHCLDDLLHVTFLDVRPDRERDRAVAD